VSRVFLRQPDESCYYRSNDYAGGRTRVDCVARSKAALRPPPPRLTMQVDVTCYNRLDFIRFEGLVIASDVLNTPFAARSCGIPYSRVRRDTFGHPRRDDAAPCTSYGVGDNVHTCFIKRHLERSGVRRYAVIRCSLNSL